MRGLRRREPAGPLASREAAKQKSAGSPWTARTLRFFPRWFAGSADGRCRPPARS
jgi:hypothetical protein